MGAELSNCMSLIPILGRKFIERCCAHKRNPDDKRNPKIDDKRNPSHKHWILSIFCEILIKLTHTRLYKYIYASKIEKIFSAAKLKNDDKRNPATDDKRNPNKINSKNWLQTKPNWLVKNNDTMDQKNCKPG